MRGIILALGLAALTTPTAHAQTKGDARARSAIVRVLNACLERNWVAPPGDFSNGQTVIYARFRPDGSLVEKPEITTPSRAANGAAFDQSAVRALVSCMHTRPLTAFPYKQWEELSVTFGPIAAARG